jgi:glycosyltransferase involved in cell wall biosynthesis
MTTTGGPSRSVAFKRDANDEPHGGAGTRGSLRSGRLPVSVIVMTRNEEHNIAACLASLAPFDEVFVVDSDSSDRTREIAAELGAQVVPFVWDGDYPKKKQWCLDNLPFANDWVLYVDADERVTSPIVDEVNALLGRPTDKAGYFAGYNYSFAGKVLKHGHRVYKLVLLDRRRGHFPQYDDLDVANPVEVELHFQPRVDGSVGMLKARMLHDDHKALFQWIDRHNRYSDWEALLRVRGQLPRPDDTQPRMRGALKAVFNRIPAKGLVAFLWSYVFRAGFLDGRAGFHFAIARGFYYWQIGQKMREYERRTPSGE